MEDTAMNLIPNPKHLTRKPGTFSLEIPSLILADGCDNRLSFHALQIRNTLKDLQGFAPDLRAGEPAPGAIYISHSSRGDGYSLEISPKQIKILGDGPSGAFYGLQTLGQLLFQYGNELPCLYISDTPDFADRGFYHDISRGRVPTLDQLKAIVRELSSLKINCLELYVESNFEFTECLDITDPENRLTAEELLELDQFCHLYFIELVPSLSTFGHLYDLLQSRKYRHLCELADYKPSNHYWMEKMDHHTIDVFNPESLSLICSLIDQYLPLFCSNRFNICCDETFDLCKGKNAGQDSAQAYLSFVTKLISHVKSHGKTVQMWGDILLEHPEKVSLLPKDTVLLNWCYLKDPVKKNVEFFGQSGYAQIVCPGTSSWNRFVEEIDRSTGNITKMAQYGYENHAQGLLNTNWGDFGAICSWNCQQFGIAAGAEKSWNALGDLDEYFDRSVSALLYKQRDVNVVQLIRELGDCQRTAEWARLVPWFSARKRGEEEELEADIPKILEHIAHCQELLQKFRELGADTDPCMGDLAVAAQAIRLLNQTVLFLSGHAEFTRTQLKEWWEAWIPDYENAWLRENKLSQLGLVVQFLEQLTKM
jgi:hypothetical protein